MKKGTTVTLKENVAQERNRLLEIPVERVDFKNAMNKELKVDKYEGHIGHDKSVAFFRLDGATVNSSHYGRGKDGEVQIYELLIPETAIQIKA